VMDANPICYKENENNTTRKRIAHTVPLRTCNLDSNTEGNLS